MAVTYTAQTVSDDTQAVGTRFTAGGPFDTYNQRRFFGRMDISGYTGGDATIYGLSTDNAIMRENVVSTGSPDNPPAT